MLITHENALFLALEEKEFTNANGNKVSYAKARLIGDDNDLDECVVNKDLIDA